MIGSGFGPVLSAMGLLVLLPLALLAAWLIARRLGWLPQGRALSGSAPLGNRISHGAEALVLFCVAAALFIFTATNTSTGGRLLILDQLRPGFALVNILTAAAAGLGVLLGVLMALFWRTSTGVIAGAGVLAIYGMVLNGSETLLESLAPRDATTPEVSLTFMLSTPEVEGAELYVNGVHLGTLPFETTYEEFHRQVPFWENEPNELRPGNLRSWLHVPVRRHPGSSQPSTQFYPPWVEIVVPKHPSERNQVHRSLRKARTHYARVKLGEEWGYWQISGGSSSVAGRYGQRTTVVPLAVIFPARQERIEKLLDVARLHDYAPGPAWFEAMETYRSDGWIAVQKAMDEEPGMSQVLDRWATWKYDLDGATDVESAWRVFERIRKQANEQQYYITSDIAGRAVELLAPRLDPDRLVRLARSIIRSTQLYSWNSWQMNGRTQFGMSYSPGGFRTGAGRITGYSGGGRGDRRLAPGDFAVAHAVWRLDEIMDARDDTQPNLVERELVPAFLARNYDNATLLRIAAQIGGPAVERFLLRQNWRADPEDLPWKHQTRIGAGDPVNGWLHLLANLPAPAGRQFRQEHEHHLMEMADRFSEHVVGSLWDRGLEFFFLDLDLGSNSLALKYWPRFQEAVAREHDALSLQYQYLQRLEPLSTVDMYVPCWKEFRGDFTEFVEALDSFAKASVPYGKRRQIHAALADQIQRDVRNVDATHEPDEQKLRRNLLLRLEEQLLPITDEARAPDLLAELRAGSPRYQPQNVAAWLAHGAPAHPLIKMLAEAHEPALRLLVMGALREHPTPTNRAILQELLHDQDDQVRTAAQTVAAELRTLDERRG